MQMLACSPCNPLFTHDVVELFHYLTGHAGALDHSALLVAPLTMRSRLEELIHREAKHKRSGRPARIVAKTNQLEDPRSLRPCAKHRRRAYRSTSSSADSAAFAGKLLTAPTISTFARSSDASLEHSRIFYFAN